MTADHNLAAVDDVFRFQAIFEAAELAESFARSVAEAAWRGDRLTTGVHLQQLRLTTIEAIRLFKTLDAEAAAAGAAA